MNPQKKFRFAIVGLLLLVSCGVNPDTLGDSSFTSSLEPNPVLSGTIEHWETGKTGILKFRLVKKNTSGSSLLFDTSRVFGTYLVNTNGAFSAPLPKPSDLASFLEDAKTTISSIPCLGSNPVVTENVKATVVFLDLFSNDNTPSGTQVLAATNDQTEHYDLATIPVKTKMAFYVFVEHDVSLYANCGLLVYGTYKVNLNLKMGWNLLSIEVKSRGGIFNATDYRISTDGIPEGLKWFTFGTTSNTPKL